MRAPDEVQREPRMGAVPGLEEHAGKKQEPPRAKGARGFLPCSDE